MADIVTPEVRSRMMAGIGAADTKPELAVRQGLHAMGRRFRIGSRYRVKGRLLPGRPDLVFPAVRAVILVHGCFWHGHACHLFRWPASREQFWRTKIRANIARDGRVRSQLRDAGWRVLEVWECSLKGRHRLPVNTVIDLCIAFLDGDAGLAEITGNQTKTGEASA